MLAHAYKYMLAIDKYKTLSKAAHELFITQSALTKYIIRLEAELNIKLLVHSKNKKSGVEFTPAGKKFIEAARKICSVEKALFDSFHTPIVNNAQISIGMTTESLSLNFPYILLACHRKFPSLTLRVHEGLAKNLLKMLDNRQIDMIVNLAINHENDANIYKLSLTEEEPFLLAVPRSNKVCQKMDLSNNSPLTPYYLPPEKFVNQDFIICPDSVGVGHMSRIIFQKFNLKPRIVMQVMKNEAALRIASTGIGSCFCPVRTPLRIQLVYPMAYFSLQKTLITRPRYNYMRNEENQSYLLTELSNFIQRLSKEQGEISLPACQIIYKK